MELYKYTGSVADVYKRQVQASLHPGYNIGELLGRSIHPICELFLCLLVIFQHDGGSLILPVDCPPGGQVIRSDKAQDGDGAPEAHFLSSHSADTSPSL